MKNLMHFALAILLFCSCRKVDELAPIPGKTVPETQTSTPKIQNLGHVFSGTNLTWKLHPLDAGNTPLFTYQPNQQSGYCMLMIDNGNLDGLTPIHAFRFVVVDMQTMSAKIVPVKGANGNAADYSFGRIIRYIFGTDKKFYVATEGSPTGGGHLIQYDPNTQTAVDLGKPFKTGNTALAIYSLNVGTDGALYGGSFGGEGDVMTFRYDYNKFTVDTKPLDKTSRYVTSVSGDSRYTYAVCGKNNWSLYATDHQTGERKLLKDNGNGPSIEISSNTDAPYAHAKATHYRLSGLSLYALREYERPATNRVQYRPYAENDVNVPKVFWNDAEKKVIYKTSTAASGSIKVNGLEEDIYPTSGPMMYHNDKLYMVCYKQGLLGAYSDRSGFETIGCTSMGIQSITVPPASTGDPNKIYLSGYPKGELLQYTPVQNWNVNIAGFTNTNNGFATTTTNPKQSALFQNADATGTNGAMSLMGIGYTRNGYVAGAGNNDRITASASRELSMGSYKNGRVNNLYLPEFANYEFQSFCLSKDSNYAIIGAVPKAGNIEKIYKYDPATNKIVGSWNLPLWDDKYCLLKMIDDDLLVGACGDILFLFDLKVGQIVWKQALGRGQKIYAIALDNNGGVFINYMYLSAVNFKIAKYNFDLTDRSNIKATTKDIAEFTDQDRNERTKPTGMIVTPGVVSGTSDLYVSGLNSLYRVRI